jgi:hypothetical protein
LRCDKRNLIRMNGNNLDPANTVINLFNTKTAKGRRVSGVTVIQGVTGLDRSAIYKWRMPKAKGGTGGTIPSRYMLPIKNAADSRGVELPTDLLIGAGARKADPAQV